MKRQGFMEEQIIVALKEQKADAKAADLCHQHGASEAKRLKALDKRTLS
jgi:hypothetical protein